MDLDHTLVNSAKYTECDENVTSTVAKYLAAEAHLPTERRSLFRLDHIQMYTKLRPSVREFLRRAAPLWDLWIHTNGTRQAYFLILGLGISMKGTRCRSSVTSSVLAGQDRLFIVHARMHACTHTHTHTHMETHRKIYVPASPLMCIKGACMHAIPCAGVIACTCTH